MPRRRPRPDETPFEAPPGSVITAIKGLPTDPSRVDVHVAGQKAARIRTNDLIPLAIGVGDEWTPELADHVLHAAAVCDASRAAMRLLAAKPRACADLTRRLEQRGHPRAVATQIVDELRDRGILDDRAFAEHAVRSELTRRTAGPRAIEAKLRKVGIDQSLARETVAAATADRDTRQDAIDVASKHLRTLPPTLDAVAIKRRLLAKLTRRGFDPDDAFAAVDTALARADTHTETSS